MKLFGWMQNKLQGKQGNTHRPSISSPSSRDPREEFNDWPHGLLAIGTFGTVNKEQTPQKLDQEETFSNVHVEGQKQDRYQDLSSSDDLEEDFTPEEVGKLQKELTKLLTRSKKRKSDVNRELANLPLDRFLNCPSSLEVDRRISNALCDEKEEDIERTISVILGRCKAISTESKNKKKKSKRDLSKTSASYLLKKMFVCAEGFSPAPPIPSLRDTFHESRMEKLLRMMLLKKINVQASSNQPSTKKYLEDKQQLSLNSDGGKWVKTDSDFIVLEI